MRSIAHAGLLLLSFFVSVLPAAAGQEGLRPKTKTISVKSRIVGSIPLENFTSVGLNHQSYVFELESGSKGAAPQLVKVSYRFHLREPQLPTSFLNYSNVYRFALTRDESCDETWGALTTRYLFDRNGNFRGGQNAIAYSSNAPVPEIDRQAVLPCYVVRPQDYKSTEKSVAAKQPTTKFASTNKAVSAK